MFDTFKKAWSLLSTRDKKISFILFILLFCKGVIEVIGVAFVVPFMMIVADPEAAMTHHQIAWVYNSLGFTGTHWFVLAMGIFVFSVLIFGNLVSTFSIWAMERFAAMQEHKLSVKLLSEYFHKPYSFYLASNTSVLVKNILHDVWSVSDRVMRMLLELFSCVMVVLLMLSLLVWLDPLLAVSVSVILGGAYMCIYMLIRPMILRLGQRLVVLDAERVKAANEGLNGIKDIKLLGAEDMMLSLFSKPTLDYVGVRALAFVLEIVPRYLLESIAFGGMVLIVLYLLAVKHNIAQAIPFLALYAFAGYRLLPILQSIYRSVVLIRTNAPKLDKLYPTLYKQNNDRPFETDSSALPFSHEIVLSEVSFSYENVKERVIDALDLTIGYNTTVGFVGATGAGKTTLIDIILGLLAPSEGWLSIDGSVIEPTKIDAWQKNIGYVPQSIFLTDETIARNIAFGVPYADIDMDRVEQVVSLAQLDEFIQGLPDKLNTVVGERGVRLSGGQRQRIGIARALYRDPVLLILDEATSALDNATEDSILKAIQSLAHKKTIIMIAHRFSTIKSCDVIYVLEKGGIVGAGTYDELLQENAVFQCLAQQGDEVIGD